MSNIFAAENNERIRLDNISRTIHMFAKMTNDEKRFATVMPRNHQTCSRPEGFFSVCESHEMDVFAPPPRECCGRLIENRAKIEHARGRVYIGGPQGARRIAEGAPPRERSREIPGEDRYTKRAVTLYIGDGEARERGAAARCQNKRHYRDLSRFP